MITSRIDSITKIPQEYMKPVLPAPKSVKIELTSVCNFQCGFCASKLRLKKRGEMDWKFYRRVIKEMRQAGVEELGVFYIGESFTLDWLPEAISYAKRVVGFPYVFLTTNGSLSDKETVNACMKAGLDSLKFSFNNDYEQFENITGVSVKNLDKIIKNIKDAYELRKENGYKCGLYASSIMFDGDQQKRMDILVDQIKPFVDQHYWLPLYSFGSLAEKREAELGYRPIAGNQGRIGALRDPLPCWSAFTEGHITYDGKLSACCFDAGDKWIMGDLNKISFMDAWNSQEFQKLREAHLKKDVTGSICEQCVAYS
jgi:radical SAM protein with 4Fe4S-binding SPASM domain